MQVDDRQWVYGLEVTINIEAGPQDRTGRRKEEYLAGIPGGLIIAEAAEPRKR